MSTTFRSRSLAGVLACAVASVGVMSASAAQAEKGSAKAAQGCSTTTNFVSSGIATSGNRAPVQFAEDLGYFKKACLNHKFQPTSTVTSSMSEVLSGRAQATLQAATTIYGLLQQGVKLKVIASNAIDGKSIALAVGKNSSIKSYKDFKAGSTIALPVLLGATQMGMSLKLSRAGVNPRTIKWTVLPNAALGDAVAAGRVDAALLTEPNVALNRAKVRILDPRPLNSFKHKPGVITWVVTTEKYYQANARAVRGYKSAIERAGRYASKNPNRGREAFGRYSNLSPEITKLVNPPTFNDKNGLDSFLDQIDTGLKYKYLQPGISRATIKKLFIK